ncbi:YadA-like family protein [Gallibacterium anatis]|uniref:YadA-like family protein n=1 Tax=Gallibacterium anatis TaxID=750 RepID=UPI001B34524D|nr:YadA-like family protein [Gallibacterium anatis]MBP4132962.1 YadA-like family protein [Gallibacterium anatis]
MNKVYKIIFDPILGLFKVVSELAKGKGKANKGKKLTTLVILTSLSSVAVATDYAAGGGQRRSSVAGSIVIGAGDSGSDSAYAGKDGRDSAGNNGTVVGRTAIGWSTGDTAYGAFSNAKGSSVLNSNFGLADSFDSLYTRPSGDAFHLTTSSNKLSSNKGGDNVALGFKSSAFGLQSVSLGMKSIASGTNALSVGTHSVARDSYSVAIGSESKGMGEASVAVGTFSNALGNYQLDFTKFNDINNDGYSTITQPEQTYQTSNGSGSLKDNSSKYQLITSTLKTGTDGSTTMESKITAQNTSSNKEDAALGVKAIALGDRSASIGVKTVANGMAALALGTESVARKSYTIAQGYQAKAWEEGAIAIGQQAKANAGNAIVLGNSSSNQSQNAVVIGNNINLNGSYNDSVVIGNNSTVATNGETRGTSSYTSETIGGLTYGGFTGNPTSVFSIGPSTGRTLQHVAAGKLSATSMDAVNGSQLYRTNLALGNLAKTLVDNLGDNAAVVKTNGDTLGQLSFSNIGGTQKNTVHEAIKTIAESTIKLEGNNGSTTDEKNRKTNSSFGIKGASGGGITTTASGSDVQISLDQTTKDTLAKVAPMETKVTTIEGDLATTKSDLATTKNDLATTQGDVTNIQNTVNQLSSGKADTALSNLTDEGKNVITGLVDVTSSSSALNVSKSTDPNTKKKTFALSLDEAGIKQLAGTTNLAGDIEAAKTAAINEANSFTTNKINNLSSTLKFEGDTNKTNEPQVNLKTETLKIKGTKDFVTTSASGTELTIDLASSLKDKLNNLPTNATQDIQNITNKLGDTALTTVNGNTTTPTTITQAINQITNAVNSGWEIQQGTTKKGDIGAGKKVSFTDGNLTTASVDMPNNSDVATVKFDVQTTNLTNDSTGQVSAGDTAKLVTAGDIATAINTATSSLSSSLAFRGDNNKDVAATETGDTNTKVDLKTQTLKVLGTARQITTNATVDGLKIGLDSAITDKLTQLETSSTSAAGDITNIKNLLGNTNPTTAINGNNTAPTSISDAVNQLTTAVNTGWKLKGNGSVVGDIGATEAVDFVNGSNTTATVTAKTADKPATVSFSVNTATLANDSTTGTITTPTAADENKLVTAGNLATVVNQAVNPDKLAANVNLSYTSTNGTSTASPAKTVSLSQGLNFKSPDDKLTITANDNGEVLFQAKDWTSDINTAKTEAIVDAKTYTDTQISGLSSSLKFTGDTNVPENLKDPNAPSVDLKNQKLAVNGTSGYVTTKAEGQTLTIDLDSTLKGKLDNLPTNVNESLQTINNKIGTAPADAPNAQTSPAGADGLNGKSLTEQINALRDGTAGNVVYTDPAGNRLVKGADGNYYPKDTALGADGLPTDKTVQPVAKDQIVTTTVNPDGSTTTPTQMGNVKSGLGLDGKGADGISGSPSDPKAITAEKAKEALNGKNGNPGLLAMEGANNLNKVATVGDLQALAQAGIDFLGNEAEGKAIHKTLGSTLKIEGKSNTTYGDDNKANYSADNLITHNDNDTLRIEMLKTPTFEGVKLATNGGTPISLTPDANGTSLTLAKNGADGTNTPVELKGIAAGTTDESAINKAQLDELKNQLGLSDTKETSPEASPAGKDGLDGKTLTEKTNALRDGLAGNVVYTDPNGNRLVKGSNGEYYPAGTPMGDDGLPTDSTQPVDKSTIVATTVNPDGTTTTPTQMGNVKSGLGLDGSAGNDGTNADPKNPQALTADAAKKAVAGENGQSGLLTKSGADLNKVATVGDLQALAQAGIDFLGNEDSTKAIHKTLGSTLSIEGKSGEKYSDTNKDKYSADNLITHSDNGKLRIEMLKKPNFESVQLGSSAGEKITLTPDADNGKLTLAKNKADGSPLDNPADNKVVLDGLKAGETADSAVTKGQLDELASQIGTPVPEDTTGTAGADGLNGKNLAEKVDALRDGTAGNVVYTDPQGNRLVKGDDGKYYPAGTQFNEQGLPVDKQGQPVAAVPTENLIATTVNPDGSTTSPVQMGNVKSGLGLDGAGEDGTGTTSSPKAITAQQAKDALNGKDGKTGLLAMEGANNLNKVATVGDLQALAQAGIDFLGNEDSTKAIHKTLGSTLKIEGKSNTTYGDDNKANYSADNLITHNDSDTLRIEMLKTPTFEGVKLATNGGTPISLAPSEDGSSLTFSKPSDDGSSTMPVELKGVAAGTTENSAINKAQLDELKNQLGLSDTPEVSPTESPAGKDGLDGKTLTEKANALRDGLAGNVVYTDPNGNRLVKGSDGKYYPAEQVGNKVQGTDGKWYPEGTTFKDGNPIAKDGSPATALADTETPKEVAKDSIVSTAVNPDGSTANPIQMGNVKSGLGLDGSAGNNGQDANAADPKAITAEAAKNAIAGADGQSGLLTKSGADLNKVATVGDLQALAQAGLDFNGNNTDAVVHRPLGTKLEIVGDSPATNFASAVGNINVFGDPTNNKLVIQLSKVLTNITSIGGGVKDSVTDKTSTSPEDQKAQLTFNDDDLALNNKTLSGVKSAIKPATETQDKTMLDHLKEAAKDKGSSVVNVEDLAEVTAALETELTDKGLSFGGDSGEKVSRKLGEQLDVKGGVTDPAKLTDNNIGVVTDPDNNALIVKLAKEISNISSITTETKDGQSATFNSAGMTITGSDDKAGQSASYGLGGTTLTNGENKAELKPESLTFSDATNPDGAKSSLSKDSLNFTKEDGSKGISVNGKDGTISNLADRTLVGQDGNGPLSSDYGTGDNRNNAATEGALKDLADKLGVSTPNTLPIDSTTGPSGADGLNGTSVLDKIQALRDGTAGNTVYTNEQGERLVKITTPDGSSAYYKAGDLTKDPTTGALTPNPNTTPVLSTNIVISNVNPDGSTTSPTQIANVKSGLGLDGSAGNNGVDGNPANPQAITADAAKKAIAGTDGQSGLLTKSGADLNKVATVGDLQALAQAGLDFVGNNEENVHRPLGTQLKVVGDGVDAAKAKDFESATGNINVKSNATDNSLTVQLAKDLKNLTSSEFKDAEGNTTTVNGAGITITPPAKDDGSVVPSVSLTSKGLDNGGNKITNLAKGEDDGDAVTIAQLKELTQAVTGSSNINIANKEVNKDNKGLDDGTIFEGETSGDVLVQDGKPVLKTYNVSDQKEYLTNSVYTAISNMNEQGIKFFHTNDGKTKQTDQASNTEDSSASGAYSTAIGYQSSAEGENSLAIGSGSVVKGKNSIVIGSEGSVHGSDSISIGTGNEVFGNNSGAFGDPSIINAKSSYLVGNNSTLGAGDDLTKLVEERKALTRPTRPRKLEAKGATESDQDYQNRVNAYLEKMAEYNTALADYMEKREAINEKITALSEKTQGVMAMGNDVTVTQGSNGALVMGSNSYVNVVNSGLDTNIQGIAIGNNTRVDTNASSVALGSGAHALQSLEALQSATVYAHEQAVGKGSEVIGEVSFGKEGEYRRLTNVAAGAADTDAVNVSQLKGVASNINQQLNNLSQNISGVAASSAAMANLPQAYLPGKSMVAVSTGYHKGQSAIALGVSRVADNGKLIIKASASHNTQNDFTGGIGVGYQW